jgi:hypothetical protein
MRGCDQTLIYDLTRHPSWFENYEDVLAGIHVTMGIAVNELHPNAGDDDTSCPTCKKK